MKVPVRVEEQRLLRCRLAVIVPNFQGGGAERVLLRLLSQFDRTKYDPVLVVGRAHGPLAALVPEDVQLIELGQHRARRALVPMARTLRELQPDVVLSTLGLGIAALLVKSFLPGPPKMVMRLGNTLSAEAASSGSALTRWAKRLVLGRIYRRADVVVVLSDYMLEDSVRYLRLPPSRFVRIYNPIDSARIKRAMEAPAPATRGGGPHLVAVGKLRRVKGFDVLLDSFPKVRAVHPDGTLTILGEGPERQSLSEQAAELGIADVVAMPGWLSEPEQIVLCSDLFVLPSRFEGMSNALLEALALGVPSVVTDCPSGNREVITEGQNGWFARTDDPDDLAQEILVALADGDRLVAASLGTNLMERLSAVAITDEYEVVLDAAWDGEVSPS